MGTSLRIKTDTHVPWAVKMLERQKILRITRIFILVRQVYRKTYHQQGIIKACQKGLSAPNPPARSQIMPLIYKISPRNAWEQAMAAGVFTGAPVDIADGYIHFSTAEQARETAAKHFSGQTDLVLVAFDASVFGADLRWEPSRGGALFPHLYAQLPVRLAVWVRDLPLDAQGRHVFPKEMT
jgi:uncharacterized protein (DUF952 family)